MEDKKVVVIDDKRYLIIETVEYNNSRYAYLINSDDDEDTMFVELRENSIVDIPKDLFAGEILPLFAEKLSGD
jgi:hypothetical protein